LRATTRSLAATASLLLVLALSGVAAGAPQNASPRKWISTFCGSVLTWENAVKSKATKLDAAVAGLKGSGKANLPALKSQLNGFLGSLVGSTNTMVGALKSVGPPDVKNGSKIQDVVVGAFEQVAKGFDAARTSARSLPTNNRQKFVQGASAIEVTIQVASTRGKSALTALNKYPTQALDKAAATDPACLKLHG
jgi:hypothetical protein